MATAKVCKNVAPRPPVGSVNGRFRRKRAASLSAGVFVLISLPVSAQYVARETEPTVGKRGLEFHPTLAVDETYTDNVRLAPAGAERDDWVTRVSPGISVSSLGPRAKFDATYSPQIVYRANEGSSDFYHYLNARGNSELLQQLLYVDAHAAVTQQNFSLLGPQTDSNVNNTGNRTSVRTYDVSPYVRRDFGYDAQGEMRLTHRAATYSANSLYNSQANRADLRLSSGPAFKLQTWELAYFKQRIDYTESHQNVDAEQVTASGRRLFTPNLGLRATVGYEDNHYLTVGPEPKGVLWSVGPEWTPTPRTRLAAGTGRRYFGPTHFLDFSHRTRLTTWHLEYSEDITTTPGQLQVPSNVDTAGYLDNLFISTIPDPTARKAAIGNFMTQNGLPSTLTVPLNVITTVPFLQKRWAASFGILGAKSTVLTNLFTQTRDVTATGQLGEGDFAASQHIKQTGGGLLWSLRMTSLMTSNLSLSYTRNEFPAISREDRLKAANLSLTRVLQPRLTATLSLRRIQNESNQSGSGYTENAVFAGLALRY